MGSARRHVKVNVIGAELARSPAEFEQVVGGAGDPRRDELRRLLRLDFRLFIPLYSLLFLASAVLLGLRDFSGAAVTAVVVELCAAATALFDVAENVLTLRVLRGSQGDATSAAALVARMRRASLVKWSSAFVTTGLLSASFVQRGSWWSAIGFVYLASAAVGLAAVLLNLGRQPRPAAIRYAFRGMGFTLLVGLAFALALART